VSVEVQNFLVPNIFSINTDIKMKTALSRGGGLENI